MDPNVHALNKHRLELDREIRLEKNGIRLEEKRLEG